MKTRVGPVALVLLAAQIACWGQRPPAFAIDVTADRNVLLVTIDTLRADALSSYGGRAQTPNLDALAARGARFTFAHAHAVVTLVSHATMLSGEYPYTHGVRDNSGYRVKPGTPTVATRLKALGFSTGAFVGGFPLVRRFGLSPGFDIYDDQIGAMQGEVDFSLPERRADAVVARALSWIDGRTSPFFAWVHVFDPHAPYRPPDEWLARYPNAPYDAEVAWTDHALGPLFDRLAALPRRTLVIVTADHGEGLGEHGEATHGLFAYESTLHVPLIVAEVGSGAKSARGTIIDSPARHIDLLPTILDSLGQPADPSLPGRSLRTAIAGGDGADRPAYFEAMTGNVARGWAPLRGVLAGRDKYIDLPITELYDLARDPKEADNLAPARSDRTSVLLNTLRTYDTSRPGRPQRESADTTSQLRALGYASGPPSRNASARQGQTYTDADDPKRLVDLDQELHRATDAYERGKFADAIAVYERVLARRPDTADVYKYLAFVYWQTGRPAQAIATLEQALRRGVKDHEVPVRLAIYLVETGEAGRAIPLLKTLPDDDPDVLNALGMALGASGRGADALNAFRRVLDLEPASGLAYQNIATIELSTALASRDPAQRSTGLKAAEASVRKALEVDPALPGAHTTLGVVLSKTGRTADAIQSWERAVSLDATEFNALYNLVVELSATPGRLEDARRYGRQFLASAPPARYREDLDEIRRLIGGGNMAEQP